jgi:nicotinamidase-related amidase
MIAVDRNHSALLVMDYQASIVEGLGESAKPALGNAQTLIAGARAANIPVIFVVVGFRPGYPEVSSRNPALATLTKSARFLGAAGADIAEAVRPEPDDILVVKHRVSAFHGSDLDVILRARSVETLILMGFITSGVVLSTVRHAADADYRLLVVKDACADRDDEVHRVLVEKVFPRQAAVVSASEVGEALALPI